MTIEENMSTDVYADYEGPLLPTAGGSDLSRLLDPPALRAYAVIVGSLLLIIADRTPQLYGWVIGVVLIVSGLRTSAGVRSARDGGWSRLAMSLMLVAAGVVLIVWPDHTVVTVARIVGAAIVAAGMLRVVRPWLGIRAHSSDRLIEVATGAFLVATGVAVLAVPGVLGRIAIWIIAVVWLIDGLAMLVTSLRGTADRSLSGVDRFVEWVDHRPNTAGDRVQLYDKLFYEGDFAQRRLSRFFLLMAFAAIIAGLGVASNSTATVIGAMLVAPLMTPLMGTTVSLVMGWRRRALLSMIVAAGGIVVAVGLGYVIGATLPFDLSPITNPQISSRISPTLVDLGIAIAAGSAGAFGLSRPDVSDALPGVAIAISLVPPLAVTGLMLADSEFDAAFGSSLLFTTNMLAILLAGAVTFVLTGIVPIGQIMQNRRQVQSSLTLVGTLAVLVVGVLAVSSQRIDHEAFDRQVVTNTTDAWLVGTDLELSNSTIKQSSIEIVVTGSDQPPSVDTLGPELEEAVGRSVEVTVVWVPNQAFTYQPSGG